MFHHYETKGLNEVDLIAAKSDDIPKILKRPQPSLDYEMSC